MVTATYNVTSEGQNQPDEQIDKLLFNEDGFPFELVSLALLVAIIGAVLLEKREKRSGRPCNSTWHSRWRSSSSAPGELWRGGT